MWFGWSHWNPTRLVDWLIEKTTSDSYNTFSHHSSSYLCARPQTHRLARSKVVGHLHLSHLCFPRRGLPLLLLRWRGCLLLVAAMARHHQRLVLVLARRQVLRFLGLVAHCRCLLLDSFLVCIALHKRSPAFVWLCAISGSDVHRTCVGGGRRVLVRN